MFLKRIGEEKDLLGRVVKTHVQISIPDRGIFAYGRMERLSTDRFEDPEDPDKKHGTVYFRIKRSHLRKKRDIILASQDQDLIADSPTVSARNTARGNSIVKLMMMIVIGMVPILDISMLSIITNPTISSTQVYNAFFFMTLGVVVAVVLIFSVYYILGFIDVHLVDCESLDDSKSPGPIPVYLSHPDRGKAKDHILALAGESRDTLDAHAESVRLLNTEKMLESSYIIEKLEHESDSLKMSLQTMRRRGEDASRYMRKGADRRGSSWGIAAAIIIVGVILAMVLIYG